MPITWSWHSSVRQNVDLEVHHARITRQPTGDFVLEDLGSRLGTLLNHKPVKGAVMLHGGDLIKLGSNLVRFNERQGRGSGGAPVPPTAAANPAVSSAPYRRHASRPLLQLRLLLRHRLRRERRKTSSAGAPRRPHQIPRAPPPPTARTGDRSSMSKPTPEPRGPTDSAAPTKCPLIYSQSTPWTVTFEEMVPSEKTC